MQMGSINPILCKQFSISREVCFLEQVCAPDKNDRIGGGGGGAWMTLVFTFF